MKNNDFKLRVYLSGCFGKKWKDELRERCPGVIWLDPEKEYLETADKYTPRNVQWLNTCAVTVAYVDEDTVQKGYGLGMMVEIGYALAKGHYVILIDASECKKASMAREAVPCLLDNVEDAARMLNTIRSILAWVG